MNSKNAATRQDEVENSVDHQNFTLSTSASLAELETLLASELDHDLIAWRRHLKTYLDSDATGRVPLDAEQLQDVLEAAFGRDPVLAREYLEELNSERGPKRLGESTLEITVARSLGKEPEHELLFDPTDCQDLKHLIERLAELAWKKQTAQTTPALRTQPDTEGRETTTSVATHQLGSGVVELHDKTAGSDVRKLLGGELPASFRSALRQMARDARIENAQTDSGTYRGDIIGETRKNLIQQITSHAVVDHRKDLLDMIPAVGEHIPIAYSNDNARVLPVKERSKTQELVR